MKKKLAPLSVDEIRKAHLNLESLILNRLKQFKHVPQSDYFYELAYCLLTPQSSAVNADKAIRALQEHDFRNNDINPEPLLHQKEYYIRFHKTKAKHLIEMKNDFPMVAENLSDGKSSVKVREWLVDNIKGLGWKEASHFLRNIGHRNLAILDRHILKNLIRCGVLKALPKTLTVKEYLRIEKLFLKFSDKINIPMDELDLLFWSMETGQVLK